MAEIAASIIGIATFGIKLTLTLYDFGSTTAAAKDQANRIAVHVTLYANVLELLAERLKADAPIISVAALDLTDELYESSYDIFDRIRSLIPIDEGGKGPSKRQRLLWPFRRKKIDVLIGEMECLKTTVQLLVTVIFAGRKLQRYRNLGDKEEKEKAQAYQEVDLQCLKAQAAIVEHVNAADDLTETQLHPDEDEPTAGSASTTSLLNERGRQSQSLDLRSGTSRANRDRSSLSKSSSPVKNMSSVSRECLDLVVISKQIAVISKTCQSLASIEGRRERQAHALQNSCDILEKLLSEWTTIPSSTHLLRCPDPEVRSKNDARSETEESSFQHVPLSSKRQQQEQCNTDRAKSTKETPSRGDEQMRTRTAAATKSSTDLFEPPPSERGVTEKASSASKNYDHIAKYQQETQTSPRVRLPTPKTHAEPVAWSTASLFDEPLVRPSQTTSTKGLEAKEWSKSATQQNSAFRSSSDRDTPRPKSPRDAQSTTATIGNRPGSRSAKHYYSTSPGDKPAAKSNETIDRIKNNVQQKVAPTPSSDPGKSRTRNSPRAQGHDGIDSVKQTSTSAMDQYREWSSGTETDLDPEEVNRERKLMGMSPLPTRPTTSPKADRNSVIDKYSDWVPQQRKSR